MYIKKVGDSESNFVPNTLIFTLPIIAKLDTLALQDYGGAKFMSV